MSYDCKICKDDGHCRNNINSKYYDVEMFGQTDYIDCCVYLKKKKRLEIQTIVVKDTELCDDDIKRLVNGDRVGGK